jgi:hypothetical protein
MKLWLAAIIIGSIWLGVTRQGMAQPTFDARQFVTGVNHPFFPLKPGSRWVYEGRIDQGLMRAEVSVLEKTRVINGVKCVTRSTFETINGKRSETALDWFAQDVAGNVWYMGEETKAYRNDKVISQNGSWLAGERGALAGIMMQAQPKVGIEYQQSNAKGHAQDRGSVVDLNEAVTVPQGAFKDTLVTKEWSALDSPVAYERKFYAKGVGLVGIKDWSGKGWTLALVKLEL